MKIKLPGGVVVEREDKRNARAQGGNHKHQPSVAVSQKPSPSLLRKTLSSQKTERC